MRKILLIVLVAVLIIVITGGYLACIYLPSQNGNSDNQNNEQQTILSTVEQIRGGALLYLAANHTQALPLMGEFSWSGGKQDTGGLGAETYVYTNGSWSVVIDYPVVPNPLYTITVDYSSHDVSVNWMGTFQNQTFTETSCTINAPDVYITQEQMRDLTMMYLRIYHNETSRIHAWYVMDRRQRGHGHDGWLRQIQLPKQRLERHHAEPRSTKPTLHNNSSVYPI